MTTTNDERLGKIAQLMDEHIAPLMVRGDNFHLTCEPEGEQSDKIALAVMTEEQRVFATYAKCRSTPLITARKRGPRGGGIEVVVHRYLIRIKGTRKQLCRVIDASKLAAMVSASGDGDWEAEFDAIHYERLAVGLEEVGRPFDFIVQEVDAPLAARTRIERAHRRCLDG